MAEECAHMLKAKTRSSVLSVPLPPLFSAGFLSLIPSFSYSRRLPFPFPHGPCLTAGPRGEEEDDEEIRDGGSH